MNMRSFARLLILSLLVASLAACASRYRRDLFLVEGSDLNKVKVEKTEFVIDGILGDPRSDDKVVVGPGNCVILTTGSRGEAFEKDDKSNLVDYDRYLRYKIFLQLPSRLQVEELPLENNSFVQLLGYYELPPENKIFIARDGKFAIDSLTEKQLFGSIDGTYENELKEPVKFRGEFKVKIER